VSTVLLEVQFPLLVTMFFSRKTENSSVGRVDVMFISGFFFLVNSVSYLLIARCSASVWFA
jgi:hypothetical protein